jgi:hypothetical protein
MMGNVPPLPLRAKRSSSIILARSTLICFAVSRHGPIPSPGRPEPVEGCVFVYGHEPVADHWSVSVSTSSTRTGFWMRRHDSGSQRPRQEPTSPSVRPESFVSTRDRPVEGRLNFGVSTSSTGTECGKNHANSSLTSPGHQLALTTVRPEPAEGLVPLGGDLPHQGGGSHGVDYSARINGMGKSLTT